MRKSVNSIYRITNQEFISIRLDVSMASVPPIRSINAWKFHQVCSRESDVPPGPPPVFGSGIGIVFARVAGKEVSIMPLVSGDRRGGAKGYQ